MIETSAPRRRKRKAINDDQIILLPGPRHSTGFPQPRSESPTQARVAPSSMLHLWRRQQEQRAAETARSTLAILSGGKRSSRRGLPSINYVEPVLKLMRSRPGLSPRLLGHSVILVLASVLALTGGLPLQQAAIATDVAGPLVQDEVVGDDFQRVVIPMSATQVRSVGGLEREVIDAVGPALIKPIPQRGPAFLDNHHVQPNETLGEIAARYSISVDSLVAANPLDGLLVIGDRLRIPRVSGVPHVVQEQETLTTIGLQYSVAPEAIMTYSPNNLDRGQALVAGREIFVPGAALGGVRTMAVRGVATDFADIRAQAAALVQDESTNLRKGPGTNYERVAKAQMGEHLVLLGRYGDWVKVQQKDGAAAWVAREVVAIPDQAFATVQETTDFPPPPPPPPVWVWPTWGDLSSGFGRRNMSVGRIHNGIDVANRRGTQIVAARSGTVIEAGWCSGYGYCVKMSHDSGFRTEYGHMMSRPVVVSGQYVEAGELIGYMGSTYDRSGGGFSTGPHLHFTVKRNGLAVNPLIYLK